MGKSGRIGFYVATGLLLGVISSVFAANDVVTEFRHRFELLEQDGPVDALEDRSKWPKQDFLASYLEFELLFHPNYSPTTQHLLNFLEKWPRHAQAERVIRLLEQRMLATGGEVAQKWYAKHPPKSALARLQYVTGLLKGKELKELNEAFAWWRDLYREGVAVNLPEIGKDHSFWSKLTFADHEVRARALLDKSSRTAWLNTLDQLSNDRKAFFLAMEVARKGDATFLPLVRTLTLTQLESQELWRERFEAIHRQGSRSKMAEMLASTEGAQLASEDRHRWRYYLGRALLFIDRDFKGAFGLLNENVQEMGAKLEDSLWLAGWSVYSDGDHTTAQSLFQKLGKEGSTGMGRSQGAYWAARLAQSQEDKQVWLNLAAENLDNLYGLLSKEELHGQLPPLPSDALPCPNDKSDKLSAKDTEGLRLLQAVGRDWYLAGEILKVSDHLNLLPAERLCLAIQYKAADLSLKLASELQRKDRIYWSGLFPIPGWSPNGGWQLSQALIFGTSRQESHFFHRAESSAKALGIMQLMPETARMEAQQSHLPVSTRLRLQMPGYNLAVGQAYMHRMLNQFDGDLVLTLIAYNAGPSRAKAWRERRNTEDSLTFIENIPISETRNYVKRVLTGLEIYRLQLTGKASIVADMAKGGPGLAALAPIQGIAGKSHDR